MRADTFCPRLYKLRRVDIEPSGVDGTQGKERASKKPEVPEKRRRNEGKRMKQRSRLREGEHKHQRPEKGGKEGQRVRKVSTAMD